MAELQTSDPPRRGLLSRSLGLATRLLVWFTIITALFRCPTSLGDVDESHSKVCKPYLQARNYATPYLKPYYDVYAAPYVDKARPHVQTFHDQVYAPAAAITVKTYEKYGAPRVAQARTWGEKEWKKTAVPQLQLRKAQATEQYKKHLEPYVENAYSNVSPHIHRAYDAIEPNARKVQAVVQETYDDVVVPSYTKSLPYLQTTYKHVTTYFVQYVIPYTRIALDTIWHFVSRQIWPHIRVLYGKNVEPQLSKIRERLGSYQDSRKLEAVLDEVDEEVAVSSSQTTSSETIAATTESIASVVGKVLPSDLTTPIASTSSHAAPSATPENVTEDLKRWRKKFSAASDQGARDLESRISDIARNHISTSVKGTGEAIVVQLEEAWSSSLKSLKIKILDVVSSLPEDTTDEDQEKAYDSVLSSVKVSANGVKTKAQELRLWKIKSDSDLSSLVQDATSSTLDVIDGIRDLGLQEIGIRWSNSEHVTWQDWSEYHKLKRTFDDWREKVSDVATNHADVREANQSSNDVEERGMGLVQEAAEELGRLKEVAKWKIHSKDSSDDFSSRVLPPGAVRLGQKIVQKAKSVVENIGGSPSTSQGIAESIISAASSGAEDVVASVSQAVIEPVQDTVSTFSDKAGSSMLDVESSSSSLLSAMSSSASSVASSLSSAMSSAASSILPSISVAPASAVIPVDLGAAVSVGTENTPLASSLSSAISSYSSAAAEMAPSSASVLSEQLEQRIDSLMHEAGYSSSVISAPLSAASSIGETAITSATKVVDSLTGAAISSASSISSVGSESARAAAPVVSSSASLASSVGADTLNKAADDVVDAAVIASGAVKDRVSAAGEAYEAVTESLADAAERIREEL